MELWCGTPTGLEQTADTETHLEEASKAGDKLHDVSAEHQLAV